MHARATINDPVIHLLPEVAGFGFVHIVEQEDRRGHRLSQQSVIVLFQADALPKCLKERHRRGKEGGLGPLPSVIGDGGQQMRLAGAVVSGEQERPLRPGGPRLRRHQRLRLRCWLKGGKGFVVQPALLPGGTQPAIDQSAPLLGQGVLDLLLLLLLSAALLAGTGAAVKPSVFPPPRLDHATGGTRPGQRARILAQQSPFNQRGGKEMVQRVHRDDTPFDMTLFDMTLFDLAWFGLPWFGLPAAFTARAFGTRPDPTDGAVRCGTKAS